MTFFAFVAFLLGSHAAAAPIPHPDTYTEIFTTNVNSVDPAGGRFATSNIYETLFEMDGAAVDRFVPLLAAKVPSLENGLISKDGRTYHIPLRKDVRFSDGSPMTPEDVRYSLQRFLLAHPESGYAYLLLKPVLGLDRPNDAKGALPADAWRRADAAIRVDGGDLLLTLPKPFAPLVSILSFLVPVVSKPWAAAHGDWDGTEKDLARVNALAPETSYFREHALGTGPFALERWDRLENVTVLSRNERYWRTHAALKRAVVRAVGVFGTAKLMLEAGDADALNADASQVSQLRGEPGVEVQDGLPALTISPVVVFNFSISTATNRFIGSGALDGGGVPPDFFADPDVRRGFAHAFDHETFTRDVLRGKGGRETGFIPAGLLGRRETPSAASYDLKKAEAHLRKAWGGRVWEKGFRLTIVYNEGGSVRQNVGEFFKRALERLNPKFHVDVRPLLWPLVMDAMDSRRLPLYVGTMSPEFPDPHPFAYHFFHSAGGFAKFGGYGRPEYDALVDAAAAEPDPKRRAALYGKLQDKLDADLPFLVTVRTPRIRVQRTWVKGWVNNPVFPPGPDGTHFYPLRKE